MSEAQVTLIDAIGNVEVLDEIPLAGALERKSPFERQNMHNSDVQPTLEAPAVPLEYRVSFDTNFEDKGAFVSSQSKYVEEAVRHAELNNLLEVWK